MIKAFAVLIALTSVANAQSVQQSGVVTPGHATMWTTNGVIQDAGVATQGFLSAIGVTASGPGICQNSGPATGAYNQICLSPTSSSAKITVGSFGGATPSFQFVVNGTTYNFPFTGPGTGIIGPVSSAIGDVACWNSTIGAALSDCGSGANLVNGPVSTTIGHVPTWNNTVGKLLSDAIGLTIDSSGHVVAGGGGPRVGLFSETAPLLVNGVGATALPPIVGIFNWQSANEASELQMLVSHGGGVIGTQGAVVNNDKLGHVSFGGSDGTAFFEAARVMGLVDAAVTTGVVPGRLEFATTVAGGSGLKTERVRIDNTGQSISNQIGSTDIGAGSFLITNSVDGSNNPGTLWGNQYSADTTATYIALQKSRGTTVGSQVIVVNGDGLGSLTFNGSDGSNFRASAGIEAFADAVPTAGQRPPGRLGFYTTIANVLTEQVRIDHNGFVFMYHLATTPGSKQPLCIDTSTKEVYQGSGSAC
jgi:hypothetical protein